MVSRARCCRDRTGVCSRGRAAPAQAGWWLVKKSLRGLSWSGAPAVWARFINLGGSGPDAAEHGLHRGGGLLWPLLPASLSWEEGS